MLRFSLQSPFEQSLDEFQLYFMPQRPLVPFLHYSPSSLNVAPSREAADFLPRHAEGLGYPRPCLCMV